MFNYLWGEERAADSPAEVADTRKSMMDALAAHTFTLKDDGKTHSRDLCWSGNMLLDIKERVALKMTHKKIKEN